MSPATSAIIPLFNTSPKPAKGYTPPKGIVFSHIHGTWRENHDQRGTPPFIPWVPVWRAVASERLGTDSCVGNSSDFQPCKWNSQTSGSAFFFPLKYFCVFLLCLSLCSPYSHLIVQQTALKWKNKMERTQLTLSLTMLDTDHGPAPRYGACFLSQVPLLWRLGLLASHEGI